MSQNIYDDPNFHAAYLRLPRSRNGLEGALEWPDLRALLPPLAGARVIDLGCGLGWFARWARAQGAASVLGLDVSERMLAEARARTRDPAITYQLADLEQAVLPAGTFDLVFSALAFHYIADLDGLLAQVTRVLVPGGMLVASVEHPIHTAPLAPGFITNKAGRTVWGLDSYLDAGAREVNWLGARVAKQHRTLSGWLRALRGAGLTLTALEEWAASRDVVAENPDWAGEAERPLFLLFAATRTG